MLSRDTAHTDRCDTSRDSCHMGSILGSKIISSDVCTLVALVCFADDARPPSAERYNRSVWRRRGHAKCRPPARQSFSSCPVLGKTLRPPNLESLLISKDNNKPIGRMCPSTHTHIWVITHRPPHALEDLEEEGLGAGPTWETTCEARSPAVQRRTAWHGILGAPYAEVAGRYMVRYLITSPRHIA